MGVMIYIVSGRIYLPKSKTWIYLQKSFLKLKKAMILDGHIVFGIPLKIKNI